jgi:trehalose-6-phosphate synthase
MSAVSARQGRGPLIVVSNREPYLPRRRTDGTVVPVATTGGVAVALDSLMRERGGTWIAHGAGEADREVADANGRVRVPPDAPAYTLRRIWLTQEEVHRYYEGFSNEGIWPLCHTVHVQPVFRSEDWDAYRTVNARFAETIADELRYGRALVFIQDYHLALTAAELRARAPGVRCAHFWHIPWPNPDRLRMCPWRRDILLGLLANDLLAFQIERDRKNFMSCVREELNAEVTGVEVRIGGRSTHVMVEPIGVDFDRIQRIASEDGLFAERERLRRQLRIVDPHIAVVGIGVDRIDYTKGIPERLDAIEQVLERRPDLRGQFAFVQIAVPSRSEIEQYAEIEKRIDERVAAINARFKPDARGPGRRRVEGPIRYRKSALKTRRLVALYKLADFCIVSSLHDGMNLVAKEFVAARDDLDGVLILSEMTGAAQELKDAVIFNPYHADGFAAAIEQAIEMPFIERANRMRALRRVVAGHDVFLWASGILEDLERSKGRTVPWTDTTRWRQMK